MSYSWDCYKDVKDCEYDYFLKQLKGGHDCRWGCECRKCFKEKHWEDDYFSHCDCGCNNFYFKKKKHLTKHCFCDLDCCCTKKMHDMCCGSNVCHHKKKSCCDCHCRCHCHCKKKKPIKRDCLVGCGFECHDLHKKKPVKKDFFSNCDCGCNDFHFKEKGHYL